MKTALKTIINACLPVPVASLNLPRRVKSLIRYARDLRLYSRFIRPGSLCFDVGANIGEKTEQFLLLGARVISVDPQSENVWYLHRRFQSTPNILIMKVAVGAKPGEMQLSVCNDSQCSSMSPTFVKAVQQSGRLPSERYKWDQVQTVSVLTLDCIIQRHGVPDFVKIDVEGFEYEVLSGLSAAVPALSFEFTPELIGIAMRCIERLAILGPYEFNYSLGRSSSLVLRRWESAADFSARLSMITPAIYTGPAGDVYARLARR